MLKFLQGEKNTGQIWLGSQGHSPWQATKLLIENVSRRNQNECHKLIRGTLELTGDYNDCQYNAGITKIEIKTVRYKNKREFLKPHLMISTNLTELHYFTTLLMMPLWLSWMWLKVHYRSVKSVVTLLFNILWSVAILIICFHLPGY